MKKTDPEKINALIDFLLSLNAQKFTGSVTFNFSQGAITVIETHKLLKPKDLVKP